jgi:excisionase family DNA binding protein
MAAKPNLLTVTQAAERAGVTDRRIRALIADKTLPAHQYGRAYLIDPAELARVTFHRKAGRPPKEQAGE